MTEFKQTVKIGDDNLSGNEQLIDTADTPSDSEPDLGGKITIDEQPPVEGEETSEDLSVGEPAVEPTEGEPAKAGEEVPPKAEGQPLEEQKPAEAEKPKDESLNEGERQKNVFIEFYNGHKDILPESALDYYLKFWNSGLSGNPIYEYLNMDNHLHKLVAELDRFKDDVPFEEKLSRGFNLAFHDEIIAKKQSLAEKQGEVKAEIRAQKVNKSASISPKGESAGTSKYTPEQLNMAKKMNVELD